ncbi:MAG: metallophosphoesterase [Lachnospiraceae bacterium]|nr:metallophosphoesterase [Lachnospiraceae bacterium]
MFQIVRYNIVSGKLPEEFENFKIVHLSDLHGALYGKHNQLLVEGIVKESPHMIVMTGDMADSSAHAVPRLVDLCEQLCGLYPVYYVVGNHEQALSQKILDKLLKKLRKLGVVVLDNSWCTISHQGAGIRLYGLVTPQVYYKDRLREYKRGVSFSRENVEEALGKAPLGFNMMLAHNPLYYPAYGRWGADLVFAGHIHGGVIRIPGLGGLLSPDMTFFPKYDSGYFREYGRHLVVSRGLGNHFLVRVMNPPEVVAVTLKIPYNRQLSASE